MKRLYLFSLLFLCVPLISLAHSEKNGVTLEPGPIKGFPKAGDGIKVIPLSQMNLPASMKREALLNIQQQKKNGYIESNSDYPSRLLGMGVPGGISVDEKGVEPPDTKLKKNLSQIRLTFPFNGISFVEPKDVIGFAPIGAWEDGWTGVVEFFNYKSVGICKLRFDYGSSRNPGVNDQIMAEAVRYDVNNKHTTLSIEGSKKTAFVYEITWVDTKHFYDLECVNKKLEPEIVENFIKLAKNIDKSLS